MCKILGSLIFFNTKIRRVIFDTFCLLKFYGENSFAIFGRKDGVYMSETQCNILMKDDVYH
jgi:hypothetical protein